MKNNIAASLLVIPILFCFLKTELHGAVNTQNVNQTHFSVMYMILAYLVYNKQSALKITVSIYLGLVSLFCLYVYLPPSVVVEVYLLSRPVLFLAILLMLSLGVQILIKKRLRYGK